MRKSFAKELYKQMEGNKNIWLIVGDVGFGIFDKIREDFPDRFLNTGAAEQAMVDIGVGLAMSGKIPFVYSITPFLLYRPFESIRNFLNREKVPVKLVGAGRNNDYFADGFTHWAEEDKKVMMLFENIEHYIPTSELDVELMTRGCVINNKPCYINLPR